MTEITSPDVRATRLLLVIVLLTVSSSVLAQAPLSFVDVTLEAGFRSPDTDKTSSPSIGDLNGDGFYDIVQCNHARKPVDVYYGSANGTFRFTQFFEKKQDRHATAIADFDNDGKVEVLLTIGGGSVSFGPRKVVIGKPNGAGDLERIEAKEFGFVGGADTGVFSTSGGRFVDIDSDGDLDFIQQGRPLFKLLQSRGVDIDDMRNVAVYENLGRGNFKLRTDPTGLEIAQSTGFLMTDYNQDGFPDMFLIGKKIQLFRNNGDFTFTDVSTRPTLPGKYKQDYNGAVEIDIDNDGDMDVFFGGGIRLKNPTDPGDDVLLENVGGVYKDISSSAGIPTGGVSQGVTVADFNNDGFQDIFLPSVGPGNDRILDRILLNNGDKTFTVISNHGANGPLAGDRTYPAGSQAFDYNRDGLQDVFVVTRGPPVNGQVRMFKNTLRNAGNYIVVKVPLNKQGATMMDAVVEVMTADATLTKRVGTPGESRTQSLIDDVHFGLGTASRVQAIKVTMSNGRILRKAGSFRVNRTIRFR